MINFGNFCFMYVQELLLFIDKYINKLYKKLSNKKYKKVNDYCNP